MKDISPLRRFVKITEKQKTSTNTAVKKFHLKNPKGIILYQDEASSLSAYKKISAYNSFKNNDQEANLESENIDYISLKLSNLISKKFSVSEVSNIYINNKEKLFPDMLLRLHGYVESIKNRKAINIVYDGSMLTITLDQAVSFHREKDFFQDRFVFIIGKISSLEKKLAIKGIVILT